MYDNYYNNYFNNCNNNNNNNVPVGYRAVMLEKKNEKKNGGRR